MRRSRKPLFRVTGIGGSNPPLSATLSETMIKIFPRILFLYFITLLSVFAQGSKENWVPVSMANTSALYINVTDLSSFTGDEIYVWTLQETKESLSMEGVDGSIYKTKTYYLISKKLKRYSIMQVMYFDENDNLLKSYSYDHNTDNTNFRYSTPIMKDSETEKIFAKCLEFIPSNPGNNTKN